MKEILALALEPRCTVRHHSFALGGSNLAAKIGLSRLAKLAFLAFRCAVDESSLAIMAPRGSLRASTRRKHVLQSDDVITRLHISDTLTNGFDNTGTLVSQDDGESTLGILAGQSVGVFALPVRSGKTVSEGMGVQPVWHTPV